MSDLDSALYSVCDRLAADPACAAEVRILSDFLRGRMIPPNPPEPTAPSGEEQTGTALTTIAHTLGKLELQIRHHLDAEWTPELDDATQAAHDALTVLDSRLSALHTELERTRTELDEANAAIRYDDAEITEQVDARTADLRAELERTRAERDEAIRDCNVARAEWEATRGESERVMAALDNIATYPVSEDVFFAAEDAKRLTQIAWDVIEGMSETTTTHKEQTMELGEFHETDGWYFKRLPDGAVRIRKQTADGEIVHVIPAFGWASIVAHVSANGEASAFTAACDLHGHA